MKPIMIMTQAEQNLNPEFDYESHQLMLDANACLVGNCMFTV